MATDPNEVPVNSLVNAQSTNASGTNIFGDTTILAETTAQLVKWNYKKDKSYISDALTNAQFSDKNTDNYQVFTNTVTLSHDGKILSISNNGNTAFYVRENVNGKKFMKNYVK